MENEESNEAKLLRLLIGYFHLSLLNQLALLRHSKSFETLDQSQKDSLVADMMAGVAGIAKQATPKTVEEILSALPSAKPTILQ
jgi:hypothetical protein